MNMQPKVVLVVEDDDCIREIVAESLSDLHIYVVQASNAPQALNILREAPSTIDLLFTDVKMPGVIDGMELASYVTKVWPSIPILITSGHQRPRSHELPVRSLFLPKPYTFAQLHRIVLALTYADLAGQADVSHREALLNLLNSEIARSTEIDF